MSEWWRSDKNDKRSLREGRILEKEFIYTVKCCSREDLYYRNDWINERIDKYNLPLKNIVFRAIHVMSTLLFQKTIITSKSKNHIKALQRRLNSWKSGDTEESIFVATTIQNFLNHISRPKAMVELSKSFINMM